MRFGQWIGVTLMALGLASCGENAPPQTQAQPQALSQAPSSSANGPARQAPARAVQNAIPVPPPDAQWTILCDSVEGPGHVEEAGMLKSRLVQLSGMSDWYIIHREKESTIYYGYYRSLDNRGEKQRAETDRTRITALTDRLGNRLLRGGILVPVTMPDPEAPPDWNLLNTSKDAYWTIEVATFSGDPRRKEAAVQAVRELREKGETQAFYYHGPTVSSVCIGAWPREAVAAQGTGIDKHGNDRDDAHTANPDQPLLVFSDVAPPNLASRVLEPGTGKPMTVEAPKLDIRNAEMKAKVAQYPHHYANYKLFGAEHDGKVYPDSSVLVAIPHDQAMAPAPGPDDYQLTGGLGTGSAPAPIQRPTPSSPGDSVLKSIGDR